MRCGVIRVELKCAFILFTRFVRSGVFLQTRTVIEMRFGAVRHVRDQPTHPLYVGNREMCLPKPECAKWHYEYAHPFQAVPCPAGNQSAERYVSRSTGEPQRLTRRASTNPPDTSDRIKMQQCRC